MKKILAALALLLAFGVQAQQLIYPGTPMSPVQANLVMNTLAANVCQYSTTGFCGDTASLFAAISCAPASHVITTTVSLPATYIGANAVVGGCGAIAAQNPHSATAQTPTAPGSAYTPSSPGVTGDVLTITGGTCTTQPQVTVLTVTGGGATGPIQTFFTSTAGVCTVAPAGARTATGGTGTAATFTLTYGGVPLTGTVTAVGTNNFTISSSPIATVSGVTEYWAVGHDDAPAINAALATGANAIYFPVTATAPWASSVLPQYGQYTQISIPINYKINIDCQGGTLNALATMSAQFKLPQNTGQFWQVGGSGTTNCRFEGLGQVNYNIDQEASLWTHTNDAFFDAIIANVYVNAPGNAQNNSWTNMQIQNQASLVPLGSQWLFYDDPTDTDDRILNFTGDSSYLGGIFFGSHDLVATAVHLYYTYSGSEFDMANTENTVISASVDNPPPGQAVFRIRSPSTLNLINDWTVNMSGLPWQGQYGVYVESGALVNSVGCGAVQNTSGLSVSHIVTFAGAQGSNAVAPCIPLAVTPINGAGGMTVNGGQINLNVDTNNSVHIADTSSTATTTMGNALNTTNLGSGTLQTGGKLFDSATAPTISSGFGTSPTITAPNGTASFELNVGTGGVATNGVIGMPTTANKWSCSVADTTSPTANSTAQTGSNANSVTVTNFVRTTGVAGAWPASDNITLNCFPH